MWTSIKNVFKVILLKPIYNLLMALVFVIPGNNLGVAIIVLTLIIRMALYPLSASSFEAQKKIKKLQPELDKIKKKYKGDKEGEAKATMDLYTRYKINPLASCLPLLLQFPILIILYYTLKISLDTSRFDLLYSFTPRPETVNPIFLSIDLSEPSIYLAIAAGVLQFVQSKMTMPSKSKKDPKNKKDSQSMLQNIMGNQMLYFFPILTIYIGSTLPAALTLYWLVTILFTVGQQYYIMNFKKSSSIEVSIKDKNEK